MKPNQKITAYAIAGMRLTSEREEAIRSVIDEHFGEGKGYFIPMLREMLGEIDALRAERDQLMELNGMSMGSDRVATLKDTGQAFRRPGRKGRRRRNEII